MRAAAQSADGQIERLTPRVRRWRETWCERAFDSPLDRVELREGREAIADCAWNDEPGLFDLLNVAEERATESGRAAYFQLSLCGVDSSKALATLSVRLRPTEPPAPTATDSTIAELRALIVDQAQASRQLLGAATQGLAAISGALGVVLNASAGALHTQTQRTAEAEKRADKAEQQARDLEDIASRLETKLNAAETEGGAAIEQELFKVFGPVIMAKLQEHFTAPAPKMNGAKVTAKVVSEKV